MIWTIAKKDLTRMFRDRKALLITILMPAILTIILGFSVGQFLGNEIYLEPAKIAVVNEVDKATEEQQINLFLADLFETGWLSIEETEEIKGQLPNADFTSLFIEEVLEDETIKAFIHYEQMEKEEALRQLDNGDLTSVVIFPEDFNSTLLLRLFISGEQSTTVTLLHNSNSTIRAGIVESVVEGFTSHLATAVVGKDALLEVGLQLKIGEPLFQQIGPFIEKVLVEQATVIQTEEVSLAGMKKINGFQYYAAAMGVMFMLFTAAYGASYAISEKQGYCFDRMKLSGINTQQILAARFLSTAIFTFLQLFILILFSSLIFQVEWGNIVSVFILTSAAAFTIGALAALLATFNLILNDERISNLFQGIIIPIFALIGGSFIAISQMPELIQILGSYTINGAALNGYLKIMQGYSISEVTFNLSIIFLNGLILFILSMFIVRLKEV